MDFDSLWTRAVGKSREQYGIQAGKNALFTAETVFRLFAGQPSFSYVECGVYLGTTFLPLYHFFEGLFPEFSMIAVDSFAGFPADVTRHENDRIERFEDLHRDGRISSNHLALVRKRLETLADNRHLDTDYFKDYAQSFLEKIKGKPQISTVACTFDRLGSAMKDNPGPFDLVFLDCDLYLSYKDCLEYFSKKTSCFVFDEYYSWKYPGARIACDEFLSKNTGWELFSKMEPAPYFERWGMEKAGKKE